MTVDDFAFPGVRLATHGEDHDRNCTEQETGHRTYQTGSDRALHFPPQEIWGKY